MEDSNVVNGTGKLNRIDTCDSGFPESIGSENSASSSCPDITEEDASMKDLIMMNRVLNNNDMIEETPVRNGIKSIELKPIKFDKVGMGILQNGDVNGVLDKPLLQRENSDLSEKSETSDTSQHVTMKKRVGLLSGVALIVGTMIGSGIFVTPKGVLASSGSVGLSLIVWTACGLLALFGALSYAELGTMITKSGAEYAYLQEAWSPFHRVLGQIPSFLFAWTSVLILKPALFGVVSLSFAIYVVQPFFGDCDAPAGLEKMIAVLCLFLVTFINAWSVDLATKVQNFFTVMKLIAVAIIVVGGAYQLCQGSTEYLQDSFDDTSHSVSMVALAFYDGLWAYDGWNNLNYVTEEIRNPSKNLPRAIMIGVPLVTVCYVLMNISYFTVMSKQELLLSAAVASTWGDRVLGTAAIIMPIAVVFSTFGGANGSCFTGGRVLYVAAREGHLPEIFSYVHVRHCTPLPSLIVSTLIAASMVLMGEIFELIDFFSFTAWFFYGLTMLSLIVLRVTQKDRPRPYKVPLIIPIITLLVSIYLVVAPIVQDPRIEFLYAFLFTISGLLFYFPFVVYAKSLPGMTVNTRVITGTANVTSNPTPLVIDAAFGNFGRFTLLVQLVLWVAPSKYVPAE